MSFQELKAEKGKKIKGKGQDDIGEYIISGEKISDEGHV